MKFPALIEHLKTHEQARFLSCRACELRKKYAKKSELQLRKEHTCDRKHLAWQVVTRDTMAKACFYVFDFPEVSFFRLWNITRRVRNRGSTLTCPPGANTEPEVAPMPVVAPVPGVSTTPVIFPPSNLKPVRHGPHRRCKGPKPAALGVAPKDPDFVPDVKPDFVPYAVPEAVPEVLQNVENLVLPILNIDPFMGPLSMGEDIVGGDYPPPSDPASVFLGSGELPTPSPSTVPVPYFTDKNPGFGVTNYPSSDDSVGDPTILLALGLQPTVVCAPSPILGLGAELMPSADVPYQHFAVHPTMGIIMPTERAELVDIDLRQFYRIPAIHCATGALVFLSTPVEMGPPPVIFNQFNQFKPLQQPVLPKDCDWLQPNSSHRVNMVTRCVSFP